MKRSTVSATNDCKRESFVVPVLVSSSDVLRNVSSRGCLDAMQPILDKHQTDVDEYNHALQALKDVFFHKVPLCAAL